MTLSARQGAARAVSERAPLGYSRQEVCRCAMDDVMSAGTEEGERPLGCGEVARAKALAPSRRGEISPRSEPLLREGGAIRTQIAAPGRRAASSAASMAMVPQSEEFPRRPKNYPFR